MLGLRYSNGSQTHFEFCGGLDTRTHFEICWGLETPTHFEFLFVSVRGKKFHKARSESHQQEFCTVRRIVYRSRSGSLASASPSTPPRLALASSSPSRRILFAASRSVDARQPSTKLALCLHPVCHHPLEGILSSRYQTPPAAPPIASVRTGASAARAGAHWCALAPPLRHTY